MSLSVPVDLGANSRWGKSCAGCTNGYDVPYAVSAILLLPCPRPRNAAGLSAAGSLPASYRHYFAAINLHGLSAVVARTSGKDMLKHLACRCHHFSASTRRKAAALPLVRNISKATIGRHGLKPLAILGALSRRCCLLQFCFYKMQLEAVNQSA